MLLHTSQDAGRSGRLFSPTTKGPRRSPKSVKSQSGRKPVVSCPACPFFRADRTHRRRRLDAPQQSERQGASGHGVQFAPRRRRGAGLYVLSVRPSDSAGWSRSLPGMGLPGRERRSRGPTELALPRRPPNASPDLRRLPTGHQQATDLIRSHLPSSRLDSIALRPRTRLRAAASPPGTQP